MLISNVRSIFKFHPFELLQFWLTHWIYLCPFGLYYSKTAFHFIFFIILTFWTDRESYFEEYSISGIVSFYLFIPSCTPWKLKLIVTHWINKISWAHNNTQEKKKQERGDKAKNKQINKKQTHKKTLKSHWRYLLHQFFTLKISNQREISIQAVFCLFVCFVFSFRRNCISSRVNK